MAKTIDRANSDGATASETAAEALGAPQIGPFDDCPKLGFRE